MSYRLILSVVLILLSVCFSCDQVYGFQGNNFKEEDIRFNWAFGALPKEGNQSTVISCESNMELRSGDKLKMLIEFESRCYIYLIYVGSHGKIYTLFPYDIDQFYDQYQTDVNYYIPKGTEWFILDENIGVEKYYLVASVNRMYQLEKYLIKNEQSINNTNYELRKNILGEIDRVMNESKALASQAQRPILIGGNVRGVDKQDPQMKLDSLIENISASGSYSRTFIIEHK